ncbi:MAG: SprB repeat-containing protein [Bacteroidetes bacterium]|nr:SprB repeat-containing protein [Bacteroidota bacterium]
MVLNNSNDAAQTLTPTGAVFHEISYGTVGNVTAPTGDVHFAATVSNTYQFSCGSHSIAANFAGVVAGSRSPGAANNVNNQALIIFLKSNSVCYTCATFNEPSSALNISATVLTNNNCFGFSNGSIDLTALGGFAPYTYNWSNGATTQDISSLAASTYSVTVTDSQSCTSSLSVNITQPNQLIVSTSPINPS